MEDNLRVKAINNRCLHWVTVVLFDIYSSILLTEMEGDPYHWPGTVLGTRAADI